MMTERNKRHLPNYGFRNVSRHSTGNPCFGEPSAVFITLVSSWSRPAPQSIGMKRPPPQARKLDPKLWPGSQSQNWQHDRRRDGDRSYAKGKNISCGHPNTILWLRRQVCKFSGHPTGILGRPGRSSKQQTNKGWNPIIPWKRQAG